MVKVERSPGYLAFVVGRFKVRFVHRDAAWRGPQLFRRVFPW